MLSSCKVPKWKSWPLPQYYDFAFRSAFPALLGEMAIVLWLLIRGAKVHPVARPSLLIERW
jgi:hypothetical protein